MLVLLFFLNLAVGLDIPKSLTKSDRVKTLEILGFGTSTKSVSYGYPLGGYPGMELGINVETIPTQDLAQVGDRSVSKDSLSYTKFSIAKGLYKDVDIFIQFIPLNEEKGLSDFGGFLRWGVYEATFFPIHLSLIVHGNHTNLNNLILSESMGWNLLSSVFINDITLMAGVGFVKTNGRFIGCNDVPSGCTNGVTDTQALEKESINTLHTSLGLSYTVSKVFFALQIDRYTQPVTSFRIGLRM